MEEMPRKSAAELEAECLRLLAMDPHTRGIRRVEIIRMYPKGMGPNWTYGALISNDFLARLSDMTYRKFCLGTAAELRLGG